MPLTASETESIHAAAKIDFRPFLEFVSLAAATYEKTAPAVEAWLDGLYQRVERDADKVALSEILMTHSLFEEGQWMQPNYAANRVYKLLHRLGRDTSGLAGF